MLVLCGGRGIQLCKQRSPWKDNIKTPCFPSFLVEAARRGVWKGALPGCCLPEGRQGSLCPGISTFTPFLDLAFLWNSKLHSPPTPQSVCLSTWVENRQTGSKTDFHPAARGAGTQQAQSEVFLSLPLDAGEKSRVGFALDGWFGDF